MFVCVGTGVNWLAINLFKTAAAIYNASLHKVAFVLRHFFIFFVGFFVRREEEKKNSVEISR